MKYHLSISAEAKLDIQDAKNYYLLVDKDLSKRCISDIIEVIERIEKNPLHHQFRYRNVRIAFTRTFPYGIHYIVESDKIFILRIFHTKRFFK